MTTRTPIPGPVLITGGCGFLGVAVAERLLAQQPDLAITLADLCDHPRRRRLGAGVSFVSGDLGDADTVQRLFATPWGTVIHLASLVSGGAERDFAAGLRANLQAPLLLLEACRANGNTPRFIFASSIATFGGAGLPRTVDETTWQHPQTSYGAHKAALELLINDYTRKGLVDGRCVRLAAIIIRDEPNSAVSGYCSLIAREAFAGRDYACPVPAETRLPVCSLDTCVGLLTGLAALAPGSLGDWCAINGSSINPSAQEIADAVATHPWTGPRGRTIFTPDPGLAAIIAGWPAELRSPRAATLGLPADAGLTPILNAYIATLGASAP
jgi:nucleoside-diphosphate-sugar epimerase